MTKRNESKYKINRRGLHKGHRLPKESGIYPVRSPRRPTNFELQDNGRAFPPNFLHESWCDFLYWDTELEAV